MKENLFLLVIDMLDGMLESKINIIKSNSGLVFHALKNTDKGFMEFGEVYFSTIKKNKIRAWKLHQKMTLNLVVPIGEVLFIFKDNREDSKTFNKFYKIALSAEPYLRLTVPSGIWFGFKGLSSGLNLICNIADMPHDPNEVIRKEINEIEINWEKK
tara:strand:- start:580 stop:1050 length:471 start_codon:yes stop_codon:yes gene_type:complete